MYNINNNNSNNKLTDEIRYVFRLFVMFYCHEHRVKKHQHDDEPIEPLRFYHVSDPKPKSFLGPPHGRANALFPHSVFERRRARETCGFEYGSVLIVSRDTTELCTK